MEKLIEVLNWDDIPTVPLDSFHNLQEDPVRLVREGVLMSADETTKLCSL